MDVGACGEPSVDLAVACRGGSGGSVEGPGDATGRQFGGHVVSGVAALGVVREDVEARCSP